MSRLDSAIRRLQAQKVALENAAVRVAGLPGHVLELGLGNGRTYDHLRGILPGRRIVVFDRQVAAHPDCIPPDEDLYLGDLFETLPRALAELGHGAVLGHLDIGTGDKAASAALVARAAPMIAGLLASGAVLVSDQPIQGVPDLVPLPLPDGVEDGRIHMLRKT
ncbi:MAG TPA: class I SAM-dependent methyltransferase [Thalassobaculum sp.]